MTPELEEAIVNDCRNGMTGRAVAKKYEITARRIYTILQRHGFKSPIGRPPSCEIDHSAFDTITPDSAYWTGFLFADGCVGAYGPGSPSVILDLAEKDLGHIEKFRSFLKSSHAITRVVHRNVPGKIGTEENIGHAFRVRSKQLVAALRGYGLAQKCPERVPSAAIEDSTDFWRGVVDGDGTVRIQTDPRRGYSYAHFILCGHKPLLENFQLFLKHLDVNSNITDTASGIFQVRLMASPAVIVIRALYGETGTALDRKLAIARHILSDPNLNRSSGD